MPTPRTALALLCLATCLGAAAPARAEPAKPEVAATAISVSGDVRVQEGDAWRRVELGQLFGPGDRLVTGDGAALQIVLADGSSVALAQDSELTLDEVGAGAPGSVTLLDLGRGLLDTIVRKLGLGSTFAVRTPYAVAAVKGTDFEVTASGGASAVTVDHGVVRLSDPAGRSFESVGPFQHGELRRGILGPVRPLSRSQRTRFLRRWARARALHARRGRILARLRRGRGRGRFLRQMRRRMRLRARRAGRPWGRPRGPRRRRRAGP